MRVHRGHAIYAQGVIASFGKQNVRIAGTIDAASVLSYQDHDAPQGQCFDTKQP